MNKSKNSCTPTAEESLAILRLPRLPGRINTPTVAVLLGFEANEISVLATAKVIVPLGKPSQNSVKYFSSTEIEALAKNRSLMNRATLVLETLRRKKNTRRKSAKSMPIRFTPNTSIGGVDEKNFTAGSPQPVAALGAKRISTAKSNN